MKSGVNDYAAVKGIDAAVGSIVGGLTVDTLELFYFDYLLTRHGPWEC